MQKQPSQLQIEKSHWMYINPKESFHNAEEGISAQEINEAEQNNEIHQRIPRDCVASNKINFRGYWENEVVEVEETRNGKMVRWVPVLHLLLMAWAGDGGPFFFFPHQLHLGLQFQVPEM